MPYEVEKEKNGEYLVKAKDTGKEYHTKDPEKLEKLHEEFKHIKQDDPDGMTPDADVKKLEDNLTNETVEDDKDLTELDAIKKENEALKKELEEFKKAKKDGDINKMLENVEQPYSDLVKRLLANADNPQKLYDELLKTNSHIATKNNIKDDDKMADLELTHDEDKDKEAKDTINKREDELKEAYDAF